MLKAASLVWIIKDDIKDVHLIIFYCVQCSRYRPFDGWMIVLISVCWYNFDIYLLPVNITKLLQVLEWRSEQPAILNTASNKTKANCKWGELNWK